VNPLKIYFPKEKDFGRFWENSSSSILIIPYLSDSGLLSFIINFLVFNLNKIKYKINLIIFLNFILSK
jgi:hypothetical protein